MGLAIAWELVDLHGGQVRAESGGEDQGAIFTVILPLMDIESGVRSSGADEAERRRTSVQGNLSAVRVLIVDDEPDARELFSVTLEQHGAEVRVGATAAEGLQIMDQWIPDVLVSDIGMPDEDGYHLIRQVRARDAERGAPMPALALTGYASTQDAMRADKAGFQMHLPKPVEQSKLIAAVASLARLSKPGQNAVKQKLV